MIKFSPFKSATLKVMFVLSAFVLIGYPSLNAQSIKEEEVPAAVMKSFTDSGKAPKNTKPSWSLEKSGTYVLYKVSFLNVDFETYVYNKNGNLLYTRIDYTKQSNISSEFKKVVDKYKTQLTTEGTKIITSDKYSEIRSEKYNYKGYTITYLENGEIKYIHTDKDGNITKPSPGNQIRSTAFADKVNF